MMSIKMCMPCKPGHKLEIEKDISTNVRLVFTWVSHYIIQSSDTIPAETRSYALEIMTTFVVMFILPKNVERQVTKLIVNFLISNFNTEHFEEKRNTEHNSINIETISAAVK